MQRGRGLAGDLPGVRVAKAWQRIAGRAGEPGSGKQFRAGAPALGARLSPSAASASAARLHAASSQVSTLARTSGFAILVIGCPAFLWSCSQFPETLSHLLAFCKVRLAFEGLNQYGVTCGRTNRSLPARADRKLEMRYISDMAFVGRHREITAMQGS